MRVLSFDQFEFENPSTEESLEIAEARTGEFPFPDAAAFLRARVGGNVPVPTSAVPFNKCPGCGTVRDHLRQFAGIALPSGCTWPTYVLHGGPDEWEVVISGPMSFIHYRWSTSA